MSVNNLIIGNNNEDLKNELKNEVQKLIVNQWYFYDMPWKNINKRFNHRSEIKHIKGDIRFVKDVLLNQLGYLPVFYFLNILFGDIEYPGPYLEIEKGLIILYHLVSGLSGQEMSQFLPYSTFYSIYKRFWISNYKKINKVINIDLSKMFSNIRIRILAAKYYNPTAFKTVTLIIDGHDSKIKYYNPDILRVKLYSHKTKKAGLRTQIVKDVNNMIIFISDTEKCGESNDGSMFIKMKLYKKMHIGDCLAMDGGYPLHINEFKEEALTNGYDFKTKNFMIPIRKEKNKNLTATELNYNSHFGSFRSSIENDFSVLGSKFERFNNNRPAIQVLDEKHYNLQFKLACLLKNMWVMCNNYNVEPLAHHKLWHTDDFEFPKIISRINIAFNSEIEVNKNINEMNDLHDKILNMNISEDEHFDYDDISEKEDTDMDDLGERHKKRKNKKSIVVVKIKQGAPEL